MSQRPLRMEEERRGGNDVAAHHLGQPVKPSLLERLAGRGEKAEKLTARCGCAARRRRCGALWGGGDDDAAGSESCLVQRLRSDDDHLVMVDLPGVKWEDVTIEVNDQVLTISGARTPFETGEVQSVERPYGGRRRARVSEA